jgi:AcrR family transcriptional regulator
MPGGANPTARWERRYRDAVDAAASAFAEKGYLGASTGDIADRLGIRQGSLYYYFASKEAALAAVCQRGVEAFVEQLRRILGGPESAADKLRAVIANHLSPLRTRPDGDYVKVFLSHRHDLPDGPRQLIAGLALSYERMIERLFAEGLASGAFRADLDPRLATLALLGLCNSVIGAHHTPKPAKIDAIIAAYGDMLVDGVARSMAATKKRREE